MIPSFYNAADQELYKKYQYIPQEKYRLGLNLPTNPVPDPVVDQGIVNTNAFVNAGGGEGGETRYDNSFLPDLPTFNYVDTVRKYGADSKQAKQMLEKAGGTYPDGSYMTDGGFEYTNSFPDNSIQMENLNNSYLNQGNTFQGERFNTNIQDEKDMIAEMAAEGIAPGDPYTYNNNRFSTYDGIRNDIMSSPGVRTVDGNLSKIANPEIFDNMSKSPQVGDVGFENYSESAFEEEEDKKGFLSKMISRAKQLGSSLPGWARVAATALGGPFAAAASFLGGGKNYEQFDPRGSFRGGVYTMDGVNYANPGQVNEFYDPVTGTNRFDRAKPGSFASYRTLADYFGRNNDNDGGGKKNDAPTTTGKSYDADPGGTVETGPNENTGEGEGQGHSPGSQENSPGHPSNRADGGLMYANGGRAGYFFGGRVNFKNGGLASLL